jgi:integrase
MRAAESSSLEWKHVDLKHAEILIPDTKNRHPLHIPVSCQALAILKRCSEKRVDDCRWVFPAVREIATNSKTGHAFLSAQHLKDKSGLDITIHGLRRTFTTIGRKLKRFEDTSRLTNHVDSSVEGKHYDETGVEDLRETCQMIGDTIERYMKESTGVVIQFPGMVKAA